jgi:hypothetical protein
MFTAPCPGEQPFHRESEFNFLKANLMAVPCIVATSLVSARVQPDRPIFECRGHPVLAMAHSI